MLERARRYEATKVTEGQRLKNTLVAGHHGLIGTRGDQGKELEIVSLS